MSAGQDTDSTEREEQKLCFMRRGDRDPRCSTECVAYSQDTTPHCRFLVSLVSIEESLRTLAQASGLYAQNVESGWHR